MSLRRIRLRVLKPGTRKILVIGILLEVPLILIGWIFWVAVRISNSMGDFVIFRNAGADVLHGRSPYVEPTVALLAQNDKFVYPAPLAVPFIPFALMPLPAAKVVFLALSIAALLVALRLLGVRDWRCLGLVFLTAPVIGSIGVGTIGPFLLLGLALCWRYRHRTACGAFCALVALAKIFLWPILIWLIATRRIRATAVAVATTLVLGVAWALIGVEGMREYPRTLHVLNGVMRWKSYSAQSLTVALGLDSAAGEVLSAFAALAGVAAIFFFAARADGDRRAFIAAVATALLATPILWLHYLVLLLAPIALVRPRWSPVWLLLMAFWLSPHLESLGSAWKIAYVLVLIATTVILVGSMTRTVTGSVAQTRRTRPLPLAATAGSTSQPS